VKQTAEQFGKAYFSSSRFPPEYGFGPYLRGFRKPKGRLRRGRRSDNPDSINTSEIRVVFRGEPFVNALDAAPVPVDEVFCVRLLAAGGE
jgi:hypothetical protein